MAIWDEKYVSFTTFRRTGAPVSSPTWIVPLDGGRAGFWTSSSSGKLKRLRNNPASTLQPCDQRGKVQAGSEVVTATATLVSSGPDFDEVQRKVRAKYGFMVPVSRLFNKIGHIGKGKFPYGDVVLVITPEH